MDAIESRKNGDETLVIKTKTRERVKKRGGENWKLRALGERKGRTRIVVSNR